MKVKQLIEQLAGFDQEMDVVVIGQCIDDVFGVVFNPVPVTEAILFNGFKHDVVRMVIEDPNASSMTGKCIVDWRTSNG